TLLAAGVEAEADVRNGQQLCDKRHVRGYSEHAAGAVPGLTVAAPEKLIALQQGRGLYAPGSGQSFHSAAWCFRASRV
ncbi:hypothetical protein, partial [Salmonella enterica]|uniref:hypothetical protein n=1 Tax=Salmonella enterica TaxID=28901 RepID=UPI0020A5EE33